MSTVSEWIVEKLYDPKDDKYPVHEDFLEWGLNSIPEKCITDFAVRDIAFWQCVNLVANALSRSEFKTFLNGADVKKDEYYRWNYQPNVNQNTSMFMKKAMGELFRNNEVLIIPDKKTNQLVVADSWGVDEYVFKENVYTDVTIQNLTLRKKFKESDIIHLQLNPKNMKPLMNGLYQVYEDIIKHAFTTYLNNRGEKGTLTLPTNYSNNPQAQKYIENLQADFNTFAEAESALLPLFGDMKYDSVTRNVGVNSNDTSRDVRSLIDDVMDFTARAFNIPPVLLSGNVEGLQTAIDQFLTFCIDPIADMFEEEINRKIYGKRVLKNSFLSIDTSSISHVDLLSVATSVDKLIGSGAFTINEIRTVLGAEAIDAETGDVHFMTKNYANINLVASGQTEGVEEPVPTAGEEVVNDEDTDSNDSVPLNEDKYEV